MSSFLRFSISAVAALTLTSAATAQQPLPIVEYAVKFVCGRPPVTAVPPVAPGRYFTAINVHNPADRSVAFRKKFAVALPLERAGEISRFFDAELGPDEAFEIDCEDVYRAFPPTPGVPATQLRPRFLKGFAVIQLADTVAELDVVAVYTAAGSTGQVETMDVERVPARRLSFVPPTGLPDLLPVRDSVLGFCKRDSIGRLLVTVRNQGVAPAPASITTIAFTSGGTVSVPTPPIGVGISVPLPPIAIPGACFSPDCSFRITVDATAVVAESNEGNNSAVGTCIG